MHDAIPQPGPPAESGGAALVRMANAESIRLQRLSGELPPLCLPEPGVTDAPQATTDGERTMSDSTDRRLLKFDRTINLTHILAFAGIIATGFGAGFAGYNVIDRRLTVLEERSLRATQDNSAARSELRDATREMRADIKELERSVTELTRSLRGDRMDRR